MENPRRSFFKKFAALGAMALPELPLPGAVRVKREGLTFLFQGDSITDGNRSRNNDWNHLMGHGYAYLIASRLWFDLPTRKFHFLNRGISGNKVTDLDRRWEEDTLDLAPDLLSILVGINDVSVAIGGDKDFTVEKYEEGYRALLQRTKDKLPATRFVLCEPFILPVGKVKEKWDVYQQEIRGRQAVVKRLAADFNTIYIPLQEAFDKALSRAPAEYWIWDGVHPMPGGHELIAREWIRHVNKELRF